VSAGSVTLLTDYSLTPNQPTQGAIKMSSHHRYRRSTYSRKQARKYSVQRSPAYPSWLILALLARVQFQVSEVSK
jgi:hypothetical protein